MSTAPGSGVPTVFAVAVSQRAVWTTCAEGLPPERPFAVGRLDELSVPEDPDPDFTAKVREMKPAFSPTDTRDHHLGLYVDRLAGPPLTLLRLPADGDHDNVLYRVADHRHTQMLPTVVAGTVPPNQMAAVYGDRIAWRLGFAGTDGSPIGSSTPNTVVLDVDRLSLDHSSVDPG